MRIHPLLAQRILYLVLVGGMTLQIHGLDDRDVLETTGPIDVRRQYQEYTETFPESMNLNVTLPRVRSGEFVNIDSITTGKTVILSFLSLTCYQCMKDLPKWADLDRDLARPSAAELVFVAAGPSRRYAAAMLQRHTRFAFPVLYDSTGVLADTNQIPEIPSTVLLDSHRRIQLAGSPVLRAEVYEMYRDMIADHTGGATGVFGTGTQ